HDGASSGREDDHVGRYSWWAGCHGRQRVRLRGRQQGGRHRTGVEDPGCPARRRDRGPSRQAVLVGIAGNATMELSETPSTNKREVDVPVGRAWRDHRRHVLDIAFRMTGSLAEAEDVVQEAFTRLLKVDNIVVNRLSPAERTVFVLHDVF